MKGDQITLTRNGSCPVTATIGGKAVKWKREDGKIYKVSFKRGADGALIQTFVAEDGTRENRFSLSPDGKTLTMAVTLSSKKLKKPLRFSLDYKRQPNPR